MGNRGKKRGIGFSEIEHDLEGESHTGGKEKEHSYNWKGMSYLWLMFNILSPLLLSLGRDFSSQ